MPLTFCVTLFLHLEEILKQRHCVLLEAQWQQVLLPPISPYSVGIDH